MKNNRLRYLIICIGIALILFFIIGTIIYLIRHRAHRVITPDSCPRPKQYATDYDYDYTKNSREYRNNNSAIDYFRLSLSWSPTFCHGKSHAKNLFQCQHSFGFIVHGLWPSKIKSITNSQSFRLHPRNCRNEKSIPIEIIEKYFCLMPSENLMQAEWEKHGTCYWQKPEDYFEQINSLYSKIHIPKNINEILNNQTISKRSRREMIIQSFVNLNPQLTTDQIDVMMINKGRKLKEVAFCYDQNFNHIKCH
jgi:ribonuclease T2